MESKKEFIGKRFAAEGKIFTVYAVSGPGVFAHEGDEMDVNEKGEVLNPRFFDYEQVEGNLVTAGRPSLGTTKKVSLTLQDEVWKKIEQQRNVLGLSQSKFLRTLIEKYLENREQ